MLKPAISPYPQRRCDRALWFWADVAVFWLAISAICHALLVSVYDFAQPLTVLLSCGAALLLSVLICYNKYTVIAAVLSPFAGAVALFTALGASPGLCRWLLDFLPWVGYNMFYTDADKTSPYFLPCVLVVLFVLVLIFYILAFQLRVIWSCLGFGAVLCIILYFTFDSYYVGHRAGEEHILYSLCAVLCCLLYYLVRRQYARTTNRLSFPRSFAPFQRFFLPFFLRSCSFFRFILLLYCFFSPFFLLLYLFLSSLLFPLSDSRSGFFQWYPKKIALPVQFFLLVLYSQMNQMQ